MALRFQRRQPGALEVRGVSRQHISSPENAIEMFEAGRVQSVTVQSNNFGSGGSRRPMENSSVTSHDLIIPNTLDILPPPVITPPLATPSPDSEFEARAQDWTTGAMTERSSVSWMDEFDKQTTKTVERMFREIDYALYESGEGSQPNLLPTSDTLSQECEDWSSNFPHMRVAGQSLNTPNSSASNRRERQISTPILMGFQERISTSPTFDDQLESNDTEVETVFAVDGRGAEIVRPSLAVATSSQDESKRSQLSLPSLHSTRSRIVPSLATGTPILRTREDLIRQLTWEAIWPVVARCIRPLLLALKAEKAHSMYGTPAAEDSKQIASGVSGINSSVGTSRLAQSRPNAVGTFITSASFGQRNQNGQPLATSVNTNGSVETQRMLGSLLLISSKQINNRKQDTIESVTAVPPLQFQPVQPLQQPLPTASIVPVVQPQAVVQSRATTSQQQRPASGMRVPSASRGRLGRGRLHPMDRPKTPSVAQQDDYIFDGLRGQKLHTAAELRPQPSAFTGGLTMAKSSPLPPLHHSYGGVSNGPMTGLPIVSTAQSTGDFLSVAPVVGSAAPLRGMNQRSFGVTPSSRVPSAAVTHERPPPTFRLATDAFVGPAISGRPLVVSSTQNSNMYVLNRGNTLLNVTGVGVNGGGGGNQIDDYDRIGSSSASRAPATAMSGITRASYLTSSYAAASHGTTGR